MSKQQLQKELLEKVKQGVKPSDLKRSNKPIRKPFIKHEQNPNKTEPKTDEGYSSDKDIPKAPPLPNQQIKDLQNQIKSLQTQLQTYKDFKEADLKIKEKLKGEIEQWKKTVEKSNTLISDKEQVISNLQTNNKVLNKTIEELKNQDKNPVKDQGSNKSFTCHTCQKSFSTKFLRLVDKNNKKVCRDCLLKMLNRANQETGEEIVLRKKKKEESTSTETKTFICQTCQQNYQGEPHQVHITNFQEQGIIPQQLTSICSSCLEDKVILANFYCPRTSEGRDTYNPQQLQFDCYCPTK